MKTYMALLVLDDGRQWYEFNAENFREAEGKVIQFLDTVERDESDLLQLERYNSRKCYY